MLDQGERSLDRRDTWTDQSEASVEQHDSLLDQGDGLYIASVDDTGKINVTFTAKADLLEKRNIEADWDYHCKGFAKNVYDLNWANEQLGENAEGVRWPAKHWGWVHNEGETAFFCPYRPWDGSSSVVMTWNKNIDQGCGSKAGYGYHHVEPQQGWSGSPNFSIGRTWRGDHFCTDSFAPGSVEEGEFDQGDGFYSASLDDTGKVSVIFTPKDVLVARDSLSENPATKSIRDFEKRDGVECVGGESKNQADLDWANNELATYVDGKMLSPQTWGWIYK